MISSQGNKKKQEAVAVGSGRGKSATCKEIRSFYNLFIKKIRGARVDLYSGTLQDQYIIGSPFIKEP